MTRYVRLKKLGLTAEVGKLVTSPERRAEARERLDRARADQQDLSRRIEEQFGAEHKAIARRHGQALADLNEYKFRVWRRDRIGLIEVAKGDTWEEAFAQLEAARGTALGLRVTSSDDTRQPTDGDVSPF